MEDTPFEPALLPKLAFEILNEELTKYQIQKSFSSENLERLHSVFGETFMLASELLDKCKIIEYTTNDNVRKVFKIVTRTEQYTIYDNINFCSCATFRRKVLEQRDCLTCKHVLAVTLGIGMNKVTREIITPSQLVEFLNEQINHLDDK